MIQFPSEKTVVINTDDELNQFEETLKTICLFQILRHSPEKDNQISGEVIDKADYVIVSVSSSYSFDEEQSVKALKNQIHQWKADGKNVTAVLFCSPYRLSYFEEVDLILIAYENDADAQIAAAEILSGIRKPEGILPVEILGH